LTTTGIRKSVVPCALPTSAALSKRASFKISKKWWNRMHESKSAWMNKHAVQTTSWFYSLLVIIMHFDEHCESCIQ
jgi:hypothetical protein